MKDDDFDLFDEFPGAEDDSKEFDFSEVADDAFLREHSSFPPIDRTLVESRRYASIDAPDRTAGGAARQHRRRRLRVAIGLVAVVVLAAAAVGAFVLLGNGDDAPAADESSPGRAPSEAVDSAPVPTVEDLGAAPATAGDGTAPATTGDGASSGDGATVGVAGAPPVAPRQFDLPMRGVFDSFGRPDADVLGASESGQDWIAEWGDWAIEARNAYIIDPNPNGPSIAIVNAGTTRGTLQVTMPSVERATGVVFRYKNSFNYWSMTAAPDAGTWLITRVAAGDQIELGTVGPSTVSDFTTIAVRFDENLLDIYVDGLKASSIIDPDAIGGTYVGLIGRGPAAAGARWTNFVVIGHAEP